MNQDGAGGLLYRFRFAMAKGDVAKALTIGKELTLKLPEFSQSWLSYAQALQANGQIGDALSRFMLALEKRTDNVEAVQGIVQCYYAQNRPADAKRHIEQAIRSMPRNGVLQEMLINHEISYGDPAKAVAPRQAALQADPNKLANWSNLGQVYLKAAQVRAAASPDQAKEYLSQARDIFSKAIERWPDELLLYGYLGDVLLMSGDFAAGEKALSQLTAREAWKDQPGAYLILAEYYARSGKFKEAESAMRTALSKSRNNVDIVLRLAGVLMLQKRPDEALKVMDVDLDDPRLWRQRVELLLSLGRSTDAEQVALASLSRNPKSAETLSLLAFIYLKQNRFAESAARTEQALSLDPGNAAAHYFRGLILLSQPKPDLDEALRELQLVRQQNPANADVRLNIADAYLRKGDADGAVRELESAAQAVPGDKRIRQRLAELYIASRPPRWFDVERLIQSTRSMAQFAQDPDWFALESRMWLARGEADRAVAAMRQAVELSNSDAEMVRMYLEVLLQTQRYTDALQVTDTLLSKNKPIWWICNIRGMAKNRQGEKDAALAEFDRALRLASEMADDVASMQTVEVMAKELGPATAVGRILPRTQSSNEWRVVAANLYHLIPDDANATRMIERVLADLETLQPGNRIATLRLAGEIYLRAKPQSQPEKAIKVYQQLLQSVPDDYAALNNLACVLAEGVTPPRLAEALVYSQRAYDGMSKSGAVEPLILDTHGWILVLSGQVQQGVLLLRDAADRMAVPEIRYHLSEAYLRLDRPVDAQREITTARELVDRAKQDNRGVDPALLGKLDNLQSRVRAALQARTPATKK